MAESCYKVRRRIYLSGITVIQPGYIVSANEDGAKVRKSAFLGAFLREARGRRGSVYLSGKLPSSVSKNVTSTSAFSSRCSATSVCARLVCMKIPWTA